MRIKKQLKYIALIALLVGATSDSFAQKKKKQGKGVSFPAPDYASQKHKAVVLYSSILHPGTFKAKNPSVQDNSQDPKGLSMTLKTPMVTYLPEVDVKGKGIAWSIEFLPPKYARVYGHVFNEAGEELHKFPYDVHPLPHYTGVWVLKEQKLFQTQKYGYGSYYFTLGEGKYVVKWSIDGEFITEYPFEVYKKEANVDQYAKQKVFYFLKGDWNKMGALKFSDGKDRYGKVDKKFFNTVSWKEFFNYDELKSPVEWSTDMYASYTLKKNGRIIGMSWNGKSKGDKSSLKIQGVKLNGFTQHTPQLYKATSQGHPKLEGIDNKPVFLYKKHLTDGKYVIEIKVKREEKPRLYKFEIVNGEIIPCDRQNRKVETPQTLVIENSDRNYWYERVQSISEDWLTESSSKDPVMPNAKIEERTEEFSSGGVSNKYTYADGILVSWERFHDNGSTKFKKEYIEGSLHGTYGEFGSDGVKDYDYTYDMGYKVSMKKYRYDGSVTNEEYYDMDGSQHGVQKTYWVPYKTLKIEQTYKHGVRSGLYKEYDRDGKLIKEGNYSNNRKDGEWTVNGKKVYYDMGTKQP